MRKIFPVLLFTIACCMGFTKNSIAQQSQSIRVQYQFNINLSSNKKSDSLLAQSYVSQLCVLDNKSYFYIDSKANLEGNDSVFVFTVDSLYKTIKDFRQRTMLCEDLIMDKRIWFSDTLDNQKWTITSERKTIAGFNCVLAHCKFRGRNYNAWFTMDIPVSNGPWKFGGLPGLILEIKDEEEKIVIRFAGLSQPCDPQNAFTPGKPVPDTYHDFVARRNKMLEKMNIYLKASAAKDFRDTDMSIDLTSAAIEMW